MRAPLISVVVVVVVVVVIVVIVVVVLFLCWRLSSTVEVQTTVDLECMIRRELREVPYMGIPPLLLCLCCYFFVFMYFVFYNHPDTPYMVMPPLLLYLYLYFLYFCIPLISHIWACLSYLSWSYLRTRTESVRIFVTHILAPENGICTIHT